METPMRMLLLPLLMSLMVENSHADIAPPPPDPNEGAWHGSMRQTNSSGGESYPMTLVLSETGGTTDYPKLRCGGELERLGTASGGYVVYKETITRGAFDKRKGNGCIDGVVIVHIDGNALVLGWFAAFDGEPTLASARLTRGQFNSR
jgi:hypothetical protein